MWGIDDVAAAAADTMGVLGDASRDESCPCIRIQQFVSEWFYLEHVRMQSLTRPKPVNSTYSNTVNAKAYTDARKRSRARIHVHV